MKLNITKQFYLTSDLSHDVFWVYLVNSTEDSCCNTVFHINVHCFR